MQSPSQELLHQSSSSGGSWRDNNHITSQWVRSAPEKKSALWGTFWVLTGRHSIWAHDVGYMDTLTLLGTVAHTQKKRRKYGGFGLFFRWRAQHSMELDTACSRWTSIILMGPSNSEYSMILRITPSILATRLSRTHIFHAFYPKALRSQKSHRFQCVSTLI